MTITRQRAKVCGRMTGLPQPLPARRAHRRAPLRRHPEPMHVPLSVLALYLVIDRSGVARIDSLLCAPCPAPSAFGS